MTGVFFLHLSFLLADSFIIIVIDSRCYYQPAAAHASMLAAGAGPCAAGLGRSLTAAGLAGALRGRRPALLLTNCFTSAGCRGSAVFTWGEWLPPAVAERWRRHPLAQVRELLISTECPQTPARGPMPHGVYRSSTVFGPDVLQRPHNMCTVPLPPIPTALHSGSLATATILGPS